MREIRFRIWDKKKKEMVGVSALLINQGMFMPDNINYRDVYNYDNQFYSDLMQYTGLEDKTDIEIYEGDIMQDYENESIGKIVFHNGKFEVETVDTYYDLFDWTTEYVVGNIYEDPELLEQKQ